MPSFLDSEAWLGGEFLHPGGPRATAFLLSALDLQPSEVVAELGCGTGATAKLAVARFGVELIALDGSRRMLARARQRLAPEIERGQVRLIHADLAQPLPLPDSSVDAVYSESVLALTEPSLPLRECFRVLRPGGRIATNDRIWKAGVTAEDASRINDISMRAFGIPAATALPLDRDGWLRGFSTAGFVGARAIPVNDIPTLALPRQPDSRSAVRLHRYARYAARPWLLWRAARFHRHIARHRPDWERLESYIFIARKPG